jgi:hypothetical protein
VTQIIPNGRSGMHASTLEIVGFHSNSSLVHVPFHHTKDGIIVLHLSLHSIDHN